MDSDLELLIQQLRISVQVPNQAGSQLPGLLHPNGSSLPPQMQNLVHSAGTTDSEIELRLHMRENIYQLIQHRQVAPEIQPRMKDIARRLEEHLYRTAPSKEDYANIETLEHRLQILIGRVSSSNHSQQLPLQNLVPNSGSVDSGLELRMHMREKIYQLIKYKQGNPELQQTVKDIAKRLEEHLYRCAPSKQFVVYQLLSCKAQKEEKQGENNTYLRPNPKENVRQSFLSNQAGHFC